MIGEMLERIPALDRDAQIGFLAYEDFSGPEAFVAELERSWHDTDCLIGSNIHIEVMWDCSVALARWCSEKNIKLYCNVQDYWPQHAEGLRTLVQDYGAELAAASPFLQKTLCDLGYPSELTPMGCQLPQQEVNTRT